MTTLATACAGPMASLPPLSEGGAEASFEAEWHDVEAAMAFAQRRHEMATVGVERPSPNVRLYRLLTVTDEPVEVRFERLEDGPDDEARPVAVAVRWGLWDDRERARAVIETLESRFAWLEDRD